MMTNTKTTAIISGTELSFEIELNVTTSYRIRTHLLTVRHPEGASASWRLDDYRGFFPGEASETGVPSVIRDTVRAIAAHMTAAWGASRSGETFDVAAAFLRAVAELGAPAASSEVA